MNEQTYGQYIKERRKELKLTRKDACLKLTISVQTLTRIEGDKVSISLETLEEFIHFFDIDVSAFLNKKVYKNTDLKSSNKFNKNSLARTIIFLRNRENLSQSELANLVKVSNNKISLWENGKSFPSVSEFKNLCDVLNADPDEVYFNKIIPPKRIITLLEAPTIKFVRVFSIFALVIILGDLGFSNLTNNGSVILPPHSQVELPDLGSDDIAKPIRKYKVTYKYEMIDDVVVKEFEEGSKVPYLPLPVSINGYELVGYIYKNVSFDFENYRLYQDITLYGDLERSVYTVKYYAFDKTTVLKEEKVPYLEGATPPSVDLVDIFDDKKFIKWSENTSKVTSNMEVYPLYNYYKTDLSFVDSNGSTFDPIKNYTHSSFGLLPKPLSDFSSTFIGWFYKGKAFTIETPLDEEMILESRYLKEDTIQCNINLPNSEFDTIRYYVAGYNIHFLEGFTNGNKLATTFMMNGEKIEYPIVFESNDVQLDPIFDMYIEYSLDENREITINEIRSDNTEVYIPSMIDGHPIKLIKNGSLILPNCSKLSIAATNIMIEKEAFTNCPNVEELYIKDYKVWNETIVLEDEILKPLKKLIVLELPLAIADNGYPININTIGLSKDLKGLSLKFQNDFDFNYFFKKANEELLKTISFMNVASINEYPFNRSVDMKEVDLEKFSNLKKLDFIGTINDIKLFNVSKFKGKISYSGDLETLNLIKDNVDKKVVCNEYQISCNKDLTIYGNDSIYANDIKLDEPRSINFVGDICFYPFNNLYLPDVKFIKQGNIKPRFLNLVKGNVVNVYIKGSIPSLNILNQYFKGFEENILSAFNFVLIN